MLVERITRGELEEETTLPAELTLPLLTGGKVAQARSVSPVTRQSRRAVHRIEEGVAKVEVADPFFQVEMLQPVAATDDSVELDYHFALPYPVDRLEIEVQRSPRQQEFRIEPEGYGMVEGQGGFRVYSYRFEGYRAGEPIPLHIRFRFAGEPGANPAEERFPAFAYNSASTLEGYRIAVRIPEVLEKIPCFCNCGRMAGHASLRDCFISEAGAFDDHAAGCGVCTREAVDTERWTQEGIALQTVRERIEQKYREYGEPTPTPVLSPEAAPE